MSAERKGYMSGAPGAISTAGHLAVIIVWLIVVILVHVWKAIVWLSRWVWTRRPRRLPPLP